MRELGNMMETIKNSVYSPRPFVKWAGGKGNLLEAYDKLGLFSIEFGDYYEPFVGGGAVFFYLWNKGKIRNIAYLSDVNKDLVDVYLTIKSNVDELIVMLDSLKNDNSAEKYYQHRREYNALKLKKNISEEEKIRKSALFIYLNKTCYNGLYRENKRGEFNVPFGKYKNPNIYDEHNLKSVSKALKKAILRVCDFEKCTVEARKGDFVYFDPPYIPISPTASFTSYHQKDFTIDDQERLARVIEKLSFKGVYVLLSNAYHSKIEMLYENISNVNFFEVQAPRYINSNGAKRGPILEYAITNYLPSKRALIQTTIF